jgi:hypothetical protein
MEMRSAVTSDGHRLLRGSPGVHLVIAQDGGGAKRLKSYGFMCAQALRFAMKLANLLTDPKNRHLPLIGMIDEAERMHRPDILLTGTYETALAYLGDTPVLYGSTLSFSPRIIKEGVTVELIPDTRMDVRFGYGYQSRGILLKPAVAGSYALSRTITPVDERMRAFQKNNPCFISEYAEELDECDVNNLIGELGHLLPTDALQLTYGRERNKEVGVMTVSELLHAYDEIAKQLLISFEMMIERKEALVPEQLENTYEGRFVLHDAHMEELLTNPNCQVWPHAMEPADYYRQMLVKPARRKKR